MRGKPWIPEQEKKLCELVEANIPIREIAAQLDHSPGQFRLNVGI